MIAEGSLADADGTFDYSVEFGKGGQQNMGDISSQVTQIITGGGGNDIIDGGAGDDIIAGNRGDDTINAGAGQDFVKGGAGSDLINGGDGSDYLVGDYADSDRHETRAEDRGGDIWNDTINGGSGNDFIFGNQGNDELNGDDGDDVIEGGSGNDTILGGSGDDLFTFEGSFGVDTVDGGADNDTLDLSQVQADMTVRGTNIWGKSDRSATDGAGNTVTFNGIESIVTGGGDDDYQGGYVRYEINSIDMGSGDDLFNLATFDGIGLDIDAGAGDDTVWIGGRMGTGFAGLMNGHVDGGGGDDVLVMEGELDDLTFSTTQVTDGVNTVTFSGIETIRSGRGDDTFESYIHRDVTSILMGDGNDTYNGLTMLGQRLHIDAGKGDDLVQIGGHPGSGGTGVFDGHADGGAGVDTLQLGLMARGEHGDALSLTINADGTSGTVGYLDGEAVEATFSNFEAYAFSSNRANPVNNQYVDATATSVGLMLDTANGNDIVLGGSGNDTILGGSGDDALNGGAGDNVIDGGEGVDTIELAGSVANYTFETFAHIRIDDTETGLGGNNDASNFERLAFDEGEFAWQRGNNANNNLTASDDSGAIMVGLHGSDTMTGGDGDDVLIGDNGANFTWQNGNDVLNGGAGNDLLFGNGGDDALNGGAGDDALNGGAGNNVIDGGEGVDTIELAGSVANYTFETFAHIRIDDTETGLGGNNDASNFERLAFDEGEFAWQRGNNANNNLTASDDSGAIMVGLHGSDTMTGGDGDDVLIGDNGANFTWQNGNDVLNGGAGNDLLFGNGGADTFVFEDGFGHDIIGDFEHGVDVINVAGVTSSREARVVEEGGNTIISLGDESITIQDFDFSEHYGTINEFLTGDSFEF